MFFLTLLTDFFSHFSIYRQMPEVELAKMSGGALSKLRNGHPCRCALASKKGEGVSAIMGEGKIKEMMKAGKRGAKKTISLSKEEIEENKAKGTGIMAGGRIKMKEVKKVATKIAKSKPVQAAKKAGMKELGAMAVEGAVEAGVPRPAAKAAVKAIEKKVDKATGGKLRVKKALKKAHVGRKLQNTIGRSDVQDALGSTAGLAAGAAATALGQPELAPVAAAVAEQGTKKGLKAGSKRGKGLSAGGAIGPSPAPESFVRMGSGGNLLPPRNPALMSQSRTANWQFHTQLPPSLAASITGTGLYARGGGLYA